MRLGLNLTLGRPEPVPLSSAVQAMFGNGEQGVWYDPSDLSTLFQDSAGTTPVTGVEQPVGLVLDKSRGLVLGPELVTGVMTGYINSGQTTEPLQAPLGGELTTEWFPVVGGKTYRLASVGGTSSRCRIQVKNASNVISYLSAYSGDRPADAVAVPLADSVQMRVYFRAFADTATGLSVRELPGNHASQPTAASRPLYQSVGDLQYLKFDGVDDFLVTPSIDFTGTDKVSLFAGVRKLSDASIACVAELSNTFANTNVFMLYAPDITGGVTYHYEFGSKGTLAQVARVSSAAYAAPTTNILTGLGDISGDAATLRVNGALAATNSADQGTGNYGNYPLYIGRRGGTTLPFNGHLYSLIVRGALSNDSQIAAAERYVNHKTRAF